MENFMNNRFNVIKTGAWEKLPSGVIMSGFINNLTFSVIFAVLMAVSANSFIYLPFTPVPITTQVLTVLLSGLFLGSRWALTSQLTYIFMGLAGLPVFSGFKNGITALPGPSGGYIIGFAVAAFVTGYIYENLIRKDIPHPGKILISLASCTAGILLIHLFGYIHLLGYFYSMGSSYPVTAVMVKTWNLGTRPFLMIDFIKAAAATVIINLDRIKK
jgi:biotin transport system substrate-specific component